MFPACFSTITMTITSLNRSDSSALCMCLWLTRSCLHLLPSHLPTDPGAELPDFGLLFVGAVPGRCQVRRQADDGSGDAHVGVVHHHQQSQTFVQAQPRPANHVHLSPGLVPLHSRPGTGCHVMLMLMCLRVCFCYLARETVIGTVYQY